MSEYRCQYCEIFIADDAPSRSQHENGLRHKGNKDRFIRSLYKAGVKKKIESEEEKREMKHVEQAAQVAYARDIGAGHASTSSSSSTAATPAPGPKPKPPPPKPSDPYANYTTAASLGITDPDADRLIGEAKARQSEGRAGDWVAAAQEDRVGEVRKRVEERVEKRAQEEPADEDDTRRFKMRKKTTAVGLGEIYDPGVIRVKPRVQRDAEVESPAISVVTSKHPAASGPVLGGDAAEGKVSSEVVDTLPVATEKPSWTRREWKWAGEEEPENPGQDSNAAGPLPGGAPIEAKPKVDVDEVKQEVVDAAESLPEVDEKVKKEEPMDPGALPINSSLFRKRKIAVGSNRGRRQA
ncbi:hypothetical protein JB92DRAFT_2901362 [Gautieria morchelliformis]|nr:hypothetical protein JB92DRAFT_2901362 [Gautieria morchelliformis]